MAFESGTGEAGSAWVADYFNPMCGITRADASTAEQVAQAVIGAIETNKAEVDVAPLPMRIGVRLAALTPPIALAMQRRAGAEEIAANIASRQRDKRR
jgi:hypothetical protein